MYTNYNQSVTVDQTILVLAKDKNLAKNEINFVLDKVNGIKANPDPNILLPSVMDWILMIDKAITSCFISNSKSLEYQKAIMNLASTLRSTQNNYPAWQPNYIEQLQSQIIEKSKNAVFVMDGIVNIINDMKQGLSILFLRSSCLRSDY